MSAEKDKENAIAEEKRKKTRAGYRKLLDKVSDNQEALTAEGSATNDNPALLQFLTENDQLYKVVDAPQEASMDAVVIKHLSKMCKHQAENMTTNITKFTAEDYADKFIRRMGGGEQSKLTRKKWVKFGLTIKSMFRRSPALTYMFGALDTVEPEPKVKKPRETKSGQQATRMSDLKETQAAVVTENEQNLNQTDVMVVHTMGCLVDKFRENNRQPINYWLFVVNPECFGTTVENIFHVSFLFKEGKAGLSICEETGDSVIKPLSKREIEEIRSKNSPRNHVVMSFNMNLWRRLIRKYNITTTMIKPKQ